MVSDRIVSDRIVSYVPVCEWCGGGTTVTIRYERVWQCRIACTRQLSNPVGIGLRPLCACLANRVHTIAHVMYITMVDMRHAE